MNLLFIFIFFISGGFAACLQDSLELGKTKSLDLKNIEYTADHFQVNMGQELPRGMNLVIRLETLNPRVNAEVQKVENEIVIQVWGGMLNHEFMRPETLQLLLCHELGHFLGGAPLKSRNGWSSTEGQSDYYSSLRCARTLGFDEATFLDAALNLTRIYAEVSRENPPKLETCDEKMVTRTNFGYPGAQCRLDTLRAGWVGHDRPRCWFSD
jgi:hypothetical protein